MNNFPVNFGVNLFECAGTGGGIYVTNNSSISIENCIITNCIGGGAGGIAFSGNNLYMSNTKVYNNYGAEYGGGLSLYGESINSVIFDTQHLNSIYNNTSRSGMDITLIYLDIPVQIDLDIFSIILTEPDYFFIIEAETSGVSISVQNSYFSLINHDLYVSPDGNDTNSGISQLEPLRTISYAVKIIEPDSLNPKTIHLASGIYDISNSNQYYPFTVKTHCRLSGDESGNTLFDNEMTQRHYMNLSKKNDITIENIVFRQYVSQTGPLGIGGCNNITLRNLKFDGTFGAPRISMYHANNILCENIIVQNSTINNLNLAFRTMRCDNVILNNIIIDSLTITGGMANSIGIDAGETDLTIRNSLISNCYGYDVSVLFYQNIEPASTDYSFDMSNTLIFNNISYGSNLWSKSPVYVSNRYQRMKINNCTVANNNGVNTNVLLVKGDCDINNTVIHNPGNFYDVFFSNVYDIYAHYPTINYSLIRTPFGASNVSLVDTSNVLIDLNPLFLGTTNPIYNLTMPEYYQLSTDSPCINAGTPDTLGLGIPPMDLAGNYRVWNGRIDMGCYEYGAPVTNEDPVCPILPDKIVLSTYPNPVYLNGSKGAYTFIEFTLPEKAKEPPLIEIFNIKGQKIRSIRLTESYNSLVRKAGLSDQVKLSGEFFSTVWNCRSNNNHVLGSGTYIVMVSANGMMASKKIMIIK